MFVGGAACTECHEAATQAWRGSDHDLAMAEATDETIRGNFNNVEVSFHGVTSRFFRRDGKHLVWTEGPGGAMAEYEVAHVFGHEPLQQYLIPFPGRPAAGARPGLGRRAAALVPPLPDQDIPAEDRLHWTRNGQNWNGMCAECHSTNLQKGYDPESETYTTQLDRHRRRLRGLPRTGIASRRVGEGAADGPPRAAGPRPGGPDR